MTNSVTHGNAVYFRGKVLQVNQLTKQVVETWERLESFGDMTPTLFELWRDSRTGKKRDNGIWAALGTERVDPSPFALLDGATEPVNADVFFHDGRDDHGEPITWRRMQRDGRDISPLVRIYCTAPDKQGNRRAAVFWLPDKVENCEQYNGLMDVIRHALKELGALETLRDGTR